MPGKALRMAYLPLSENIDLLSRLHKFSRLLKCPDASESLLNFLLFYALFAWAGFGNEQ